MYPYQRHWSRCHRDSPFASQKPSDPALHWPPGPSFLWYDNRIRGAIHFAVVDNQLGHISAKTIHNKVGLTFEESERTAALPTGTVVNDHL